MKEDEVLKLLKDIREFKKEFREKGNSYYDRISSKDVLFYFLTKFSNLETRVTRVETKQKIYISLIGITIGIVGIIGSTII